MSGDKQRQARDFAIAAHGNQVYGDRPYREHLQSVVQILRDFDYVGPYETAGWLHDTLEDTDTEPETLERLFGPVVTELVVCVTGVGETRAARNENIYAKLRQRSRACPLKCADRIANLEAETPDSDRMRAKYAAENEAFAAVVQPHVPPAMWERLLRALQQEKKDNA